MGTGKLLLHFDFRGYIQAICDPTPWNESLCAFEKKGEKKRKYFFF
jgi:hypothetical protein